MGRMRVGALVCALTATLVGMPGVEAAAVPAAEGGADVARGDSEPTRMAIVEVIEDGGKGTTLRRRFWLSMTGKRTSRSAIHEAGFDCDLDLRKEQDDGRHVDLYLSLDHRRVGPDRRVSRAELSVSQRITIGKATVMATVQRPGGRRLRVVATLR